MIYFRTVSHGIDFAMKKQSVLRFVQMEADQPNSSMTTLPDAEDNDHDDIIMDRDVIWEITRAANDLLKEQQEAQERYTRRTQDILARYASRMNE